MAQCVDRVVGQILAGWRYDISHLAVDMRVDYEQHLDECAYCRGKQTLHRRIDFGLLLLAKASAIIFLAAFLAVRYFHPRYAFIMEMLALAGVLFSAGIWIIVCMTTPVPVMVFGAVRSKARQIHEKLPEELKAKIPETIAARITE
jgi:hypothetical protein